MCFDVMWVCGLPFTVSIRRPLKLHTTKVLPNCESETLLDSLKRFKAAYTWSEFITNKIVADIAIAMLDSVPSAEGMMLNTISRSDCVLEVKQHIRTLKDGCRAMFNMLPFRTIPNLMVAELVYCVNFSMHAFRTQDGVLEYIRTRELVSAHLSMRTKRCGLAFRESVQTQDEHDNTKKSRTIFGIALCTTEKNAGWVLLSEPSERGPIVGIIRPRFQQQLTSSQDQKKVESVRMNHITFQILQIEDMISAKRVTWRQSAAMTTPFTTIAKYLTLKKCQTAGTKSP